MIETVAEEMLGPPVAEVEVDKHYSGVSYRDKLNAMKAKKSGGAAAVTTPPPPPKAPEPEPEPEPQAVAVPEPVQVTPEPVVVQPVAEQPPPPPPVVEQAPAVSSSSPPIGADEARGKIRNLMGMLLKHRGGPGFGSGRLRGSEAEKFEQLLGEVSAMLQSEVSSDAAPPQSQQPPPVVAAPVATTTVPAVTTTSSLAPVNQEGDNRVAGAIACIDGAIQMYKNSPPELQSGMLMTLRAALMSALTTLNPTDAPVSTPVLSGSEVPDDKRIAGAIACIDGAIQMYKNSPPELQSGMLMTLHAALVSAVGTLNQIDAPVSFTPVEATDVTVPLPAAAVPEPVVEPVAPAAPEEKVHYGFDKNTLFLREVYEALSGSTGDEKYGLGALSPSEV